METIKIEKVDLSVTNNGTVKANVYPEGSDTSNKAESIEIIVHADINMPFAGI